MIVTEALRKCRDCSWPVTLGSDVQVKTVAEFNLQRIIHPVTAHDFARRYLGVAPLLVLRQSTDYFADLFSMADLAALIDGERLRPPEIRMTKDGVGFRTESIANTLRAGRYVLSGKAKAVRVWREYRAGASVILQSLHRHWMPLRRLCDTLGNEWLSQAQTNIYFTPAGGRGFTAHADGHDVFVLHLSGTKSWTVYRKPTATTAAESAGKQRGYGRLGEHDSAGLSVYGRFTLHPGDLLYLPRGYVHEAAANSEPSLHITLGLAPHRGSHWLRECINVWCMWLAMLEVGAVVRGAPRWASLLLLLVGAAASGLSGGLHFLTVGVWRRTVDRLVAAPRSVIQVWMALHLGLRVTGYVLLLQILLIALSSLRI